MQRDRPRDRKNNNKVKRGLPCGSALQEQLQQPQPEWCRVPSRPMSIFRKSKQCVHDFIRKVARVIAQFLISGLLPLLPESKANSVR